VDGEEVEKSAHEWAEEDAARRGKQLLDEIRAAVGDSLWNSKFTTCGDCHAAPGLPVGFAPYSEVGGALIGDAGGVLSSVGAAVSVPPGAVDGDTYLYTLRLPTESVSSAMLRTSTGQPVVRIQEFWPDGTTFSEAVEVRIHYEPYELGSIDAGTLRVYYWDAYSADGIYWREVPGAVVDTTQHTVTFQTTHFSQYGIAGESVYVTSASAPWSLAALCSLGLLAIGLLARGGVIGPAASRRR
jgi:hypothetical protein